MVFDDTDRSECLQELLEELWGVVVPALSHAECSLHSGGNLGNPGLPRVLAVFPQSTPQQAGDAQKRRSRISSPEVLDSLHALQLKKERSKSFTDVACQARSSEF